MSRAKCKKRQKAKYVVMQPRRCQITIHDVNVASREVDIDISFDGVGDDEGDMTPAADAVFSAYNAILKKNRVRHTTIDGQEIDA